MISERSIESLEYSLTEESQLRLYIWESRVYQGRDIMSREQGETLRGEISMRREKKEVTREEGHILGDIIGESMRPRSFSRDMRSQSRNRDRSRYRSRDRSEEDRVNE